MDYLSDPDVNAVGKYQRPGDAADTQQTAALEAYPATGTWRRRVLDAIAEAWLGGRTDEELQDELELNPSTQRPRRVELVEGGWVIDSGRRRLTRAGREAVVWVLSDLGSAAMNPLVAEGPLAHLGHDLVDADVRDAGGLGDHSQGVALVDGAGDRFSPRALNLIPLNGRASDGTNIGLGSHGSPLLADTGQHTEHVGYVQHTIDCDLDESCTCVDVASEKKESA